MPVRTRLPIRKPKATTQAPPTSGDPEVRTQADGGWGERAPPECLENPLIVSHALLIAFAREGGNLPALAGHIGISTKQALSCIEALEKTIANLIATVPPTVSPLSQNA